MGQEHSLVLGSDPVEIEREKWQRPLSIAEDVLKSTILRLKPQENVNLIVGFINHVVQMRTSVWQSL